MKTILFYLIPLFFLITSNNVVAQDEFYNNQKVEEISTNNLDTVRYDNYSTAEDYYDAENSNNYKKESYTVEEVVEEESEEEKYRKKERAAFVAHVVFDVFVNALFLFGAYLQ